MVSNLEIKDSRSSEQESGLDMISLLGKLFPSLLYSSHAEESDPWDHIPPDKLDSRSQGVQRDQDVSYIASMKHLINPNPTAQITFSLDTNESMIIGTS